MELPSTLTANVSLPSPVVSRGIVLHGSRSQLASIVPHACTDRRPERAAPTVA
jgi:hypothetical protein